MRHFNFLSFLCGVLLSLSIEATEETSTLPQELNASIEEEEDLVYFTPPKGWKLADKNQLPTHVKVMIVGTGPSTFPPSMNLSWEPYKGTLKQYLEIIKKLNKAQKQQWKDLGTIQTKAGLASLSQLDSKNQWGEQRLMHIILKKNKNIYILTAAALKKDFPIFYKDFFESMRSLNIVKDPYELIPSIQQRQDLKKAADQLKKEWQIFLTSKQKESPDADQEFLLKQFQVPEFQNKYWKPFEKMLSEKCETLGSEIQAIILQKLEDRLIHSPYDELLYTKP